MALLANWLLKIGQNDEGLNASSCGSLPILTYHMYACESPIPTKVKHKRDV